MVYTHYYYSNSILPSLSRQVGEVIPSDHLSTLGVSADPMVKPHLLDVILYNRSSYYYNNMFIVYLFSDIFLIYNMFWP